MSQRDYEKAIPKIAGSFGFKKSTVSKAFKNASKKKLDELLERSIDSLGIVAVLIDGKIFGKLGVVIAMGVGADGRKHVLGIFQASTENSSSCLELLSDLERRGLPKEGLLFVVDGGSGLNSALDQKYQLTNPQLRAAVRIRCYCHKWRNIADALGKKHSKLDEVRKLFWKLREAADLKEANEIVASLEKILAKANLSALRSFKEAKEDLLMLHRLGLSSLLKKFFSSTNPIESLNYLLEEDMRRVKRWRNSEQFQRWLAAAIIQGEKRLNRIRGFDKLTKLTKNVIDLCLAEKIKHLAVDQHKRAA